MHTTRRTHALPSLLDHGITIRWNDTRRQNASSVRHRDRGSKGDPLPLNGPPSPAQRDLACPIKETFVVGSEDVCQIVNEAVMGLRDGDKATFVLPPSEAYGEFDDDLVYTVTKDMLGSPLDMPIPVGTTFRCHIPQPSTLNPQPSTLNPQPSTLNPQPQPVQQIS
jgi:hypothetical protein